MGKQDALPLVDMSARAAVLPEYAEAAPLEIDLQHAEAPLKKPRKPPDKPRPRRYRDQITVRVNAKIRRTLNRIRKTNNLNTISDALRFALSEME